jgi:hypothetical protein
MNGSGLGTPVTSHALLVGARARLTGDAGVHNACWNACLDAIETIDMEESK